MRSRPLSVARNCGKCVNRRARNIYPLPDSYRSQPLVVGQPARAARGLARAVRPPVARQQQSAIRRRERSVLSAHPASVQKSLPSFHFGHPSSTLAQESVVGRAAAYLPYCRLGPPAEEQTRATRLAPPGGSQIDGRFVDEVSCRFGVQLTHHYALCPVSERVQRACR